jgi:hypothetical protein
VARRRGGAAVRWRGGAAARRFVGPAPQLPAAIIQAL